ncbi:hypothetical protein [Gulosibacter sp. 10]|uniref:hypothetical protein n=1 Tax=Gulosibacter sp. 10 TaxID=1255570 RepID=UPI00097F56F2|nr:hypothetical protein [Gulosibacter sp. 10]SJM69167.1 hypothetical protein FM112_14020 [Gulosibacter sp. 10]
MTASLAPRYRVSAFTRRSWIQQGAATVLLAALVGAGFGVLVLLGAEGANTLANTPGLVPSAPDGLIAARDGRGEFLPMTSYLLTMVPAILGALIAIVATLVLPGVVADDITGGGIEVLLAGPIPRRRLFSAYLGAALVLTFAAWGVALAAFLLAAGITAASTGASVSPSLGYAAAVVVVPFSMGLWSATATLFGALLYPSSLETRAGLNGGPIRLVALLPALVAVPSVLFLQDWVLPALGLILVATLAASAVLIRVAARRFRSTRVLSR